MIKNMLPIEVKGIKESEILCRIKKLRQLEMRNSLYGAMTCNFGTISLNGLNVFTQFYSSHKFRNIFAIRLNNQNLIVKLRSIQEV